MTGSPVSDNKLLRPSEAAERLGVRTNVIIEAMYDKRLPRALLADGTLGIPESALETFDVPAG